MIGDAKLVSFHSQIANIEAIWGIVYYVLVWSFDMGQNNEVGISARSIR